jgi:hypothetical protein
MADIRISQLPELETAPADSDVLVINDVSVASTKRITFGTLLSNYAKNIVDSAGGAKCLGDLVVANELILGGDLTSTSTGSFGTVNTNIIENTDGSSVAFNSNASLADNIKAIFGAGSDLQIYHNGSHSYIDDVGTGNLFIRSNGNGVGIRTENDSDMAEFVRGGAVNLYYNAVKKFETTTTGINVIGTTETDKFRVTTPTVPTASTSSGTAGDIAWDTTYLYVCVASNTWKRVELNITSW